MKLHIQISITEKEQGCNLTLITSDGTETTLTAEKGACVLDIPDGVTVLEIREPQE